MPDLDIAAIVRALNARQVRYVVIGGVAALVHDLPLPATVDLDVTPARDPTNLGRLAKAFEDLDAGLLPRTSARGSLAVRSRTGRSTTPCTS